MVLIPSNISSGVKAEAPARSCMALVIDHVGHEHTRVFRDVAELGGALEKLTELIGTRVPAETAIIFDWENRWAVKDSQGPRNMGIKYEQTVSKSLSSLLGSRGSR